MATDHWTGLQAKAGILNSKPSGDAGLQLSFVDTTKYISLWLQAPWLGVNEQSVHFKLKISEV